MDAEETAMLLLSELDEVKDPLKRIKLVENALMKAFEDGSAHPLQ